MVILSKLLDPIVSNILINLFSSGLYDQVSGKTSDIIFRKEDIYDVLENLPDYTELENEINFDNISEEDINDLLLVIKFNGIIDIFSDVYLNNEQTLQEIEFNFTPIFIQTVFQLPQFEKYTNEYYAKKIFYLVLWICDKVIESKIEKQEIRWLDYELHKNFKIIHGQLNQIKKEIEDNKQKQIENSYECIWIESSSPIVKNILIQRIFENYYKQDIYDKIKNAIQNNENILVTGRPLAGKTRAIYEALKDVTNCDILIPKSEEDFVIIPPINKDKINIIVFDDLNFFVKTKIFNKHLFVDLEKYNIKIVATCRSNNVYSETISVLDRDKGLDISAIFGKNIIEIPDLKESEAQQIAVKAGKIWNTIEFDSTIGSIFVPITTMRRRFNDLKYDQSKGREKLNILKTLHLLNRCGFHKEKQVFPLKWVETVCEKKYGIKAKFAFWDAWLDFLQREELIKWKENEKTIWVEEIYLERIFVSKEEIPYLELYREMIDYFSESQELFFDSPDVLFRFSNQAYYVIGIHDRKKLKLHKLATMVCESAIENTAPNSIENAYYQKLLGISYRVLSEMIEDMQDQYANKAIDSCIIARDIFKQYSDFSKDYDIRVDYAICESDLGSAYRQKAQLVKTENEKRQYCNWGITACERALEIKEYPELFRGTTNVILGVLHGILAEVENKERNCILGLQYCEKAYNIYQKLNYPIQMAHSEFVKAYVYKVLAETKDPITNCNNAIKCLENTLKIRNRKDFEIDYGRSQIYFGDTYMLLSNKENKDVNRQKSLNAYNQALYIFSEKEFPIAYLSISSKIQEAKR